MGRIIYPDGRQETAKPANGKSFTLEEMQKIVGGIIQMIGLPSGEEMVLHEEGKELRLPKNPAATVLGRAAGIADSDFIVGTVLICSDLEAGSDDDE